jgi:hypothetical protein
MNETEGSKVLKVLLIVLVVLLGTTALCCTGMWFAGVRVADEVQQAMGPVVKGSGVAAVQERLVDGFQAVRAEGLIDVDVQIGEPTSVTLQADDNILPLLTSEVVNGTLVLSSRSNYEAETDVRATIRVGSLQALTIEGIGDVTVRGLDEPSFQLTIAGSGNAACHGRVDTLEVEITGMGDAQLAGLEARAVRARVVGMGDAEVHASESLEAAVTGMGDVIYHGKPGDVRTQVDGMGSVLPAVE